jgi:uncharacterized protein (TIGR02271 family)
MTDGTEGRRQRPALAASVSTTSHDKENSMTTFESQQIAGWVGQTAVDTDGDKIGRIEAIYEDDDGSGPEWFAISTGLFGGHQSFAPVRGASADADQVRLPWTKDVVKDAPRVEADGHLSPEEEARLYQYYGMDWSSTTETPDATPTRSATTGDDAMTRSEEEIEVGTRSREAGRVRLRKWVETEQVNVTVPVRREVARVVTEPITAANMDQATSGPDLTEGEHTIVLNEEQVVVDKQVVAKERVRLEKDVIEEQRQVVDEVRKERIAMDTEPGQSV